jgi:hypothetical protein
LPWLRPIGTATDFLTGAADAAAASELREEIERLRESGELVEIVARMRLE